VPFLVALTDSLVYLVRSDWTPSNHDPQAVSQLQFRLWKIRLKREPLAFGLNLQSHLGLEVHRVAHFLRNHDPPCLVDLHDGIFSAPRQTRPGRAPQATDNGLGAPHRTIDLVTKSFEIGPVHVGSGQLFLIAGPCVIESEDHVRKMAESIQRITAELGIPYIFKASYDKANRTSVKSFRGPGLKEGVAILGRLAKDTGLPILTDVHEAAQCDVAAEAVDVLQIPAFLCRQTDLLVAAGKTGRAVNIKKGQFVAPWDMIHPVEKVRSTGNMRVFLTERGASFGYNNLVVDYRSLAIMRKTAPVVFDGTHSVQQPSAAGGASGGQPEFIPLLARAAVAAGIDGLFLEVHDDPANAKSDGANALDLKLLKPLLETLLAIQRAVS